MFVVIFEVQPKRERWDDYLALAKQLRPKLEAIDGFIDNERFASKKTEGRVLSLSTWRDEKSVVRWRTQGDHHGIQGKGRFEIFEDYHLRVGEITSDSATSAATIAQQRFDETEIGAAKVCTITEVTPTNTGSSLVRAETLTLDIGLDPGADGVLAHDVFESITNPEKLAILISWRDEAAAKQWRPISFDGVGALRHRHARVIRDYGMFERREAPQFYPDVQRAAPR